MSNNIPPNRYPTYSYSTPTTQASDPAAEAGSTGTSAGAEQPGRALVSRHPSQLLPPSTGRRGAPSGRGYSATPYRSTPYSRHASSELAATQQDLSAPFFDSHPLPNLTRQEVEELGDQYRRGLELEGHVQSFLTRSEDAFASGRPAPQIPDIQFRRGPTAGAPPLPGPESRFVEVDSDEAPAGPASHATDAVNTYLREAASFPTGTRARGAAVRDGLVRVAEAYFLDHPRAPAGDAADWIQDMIPNIDQAQAIRAARNAPRYS